MTGSQSTTDEVSSEIVEVGTLVEEVSIAECDVRLDRCFCN
jgi:hypothetical protein